MSAIRPDAWMPMYWGDYHRDTKHLRTLDHGAYLLLISHYWCSGGPIPDDDEELSVVAGLPLKEWMQVRKKLERLFILQGDGLWHHKRIDEELEKARRISQARQMAGKRGGKCSANARANASANAQANASAKGNQVPKPRSGFAGSKIQHSHSHSHQDLPIQEETVVGEEYPFS